MPLHKLRRGEGGGGGGSVASSFQLLAADPGAPANGDVWYNTTDDRPRTVIDGVVSDFASERLIPVQLYPGGDFGAKLQAAHDDATVVDGDTLDCRRLRGAQTWSTPVTITKKVYIKWGGMTCTVTAAANPALLLDTNSEPGQSSGSTISGTGMGTIFSCAGGITFLKLASSFCRVEDFRINFTAANASSIGILCTPQTFTYTVLTDIDRVRINGLTKTGRGIVIGTSFIGTIKRCFFQDLDKCIHAAPGLGTSNLHAFTIESNATSNCHYGFDFEEAGDVVTIHNTIETFDTVGIRIKEVGAFSSFGDRFETIDAATITAQIMIIATTTPTTVRVYNFTAPQFVLFDPPDPSKNLVHAGDQEQHVQVWGTTDANGVNNSGNGTIAFWGRETIGATSDAGNTNRIYSMKKDRWIGLSFSFGGAPTSFDQLRGDLTVAGTGFNVYSAVNGKATGVPTANSDATFRGVTGEGTSDSANAFTFRILTGVYARGVHNANTSILSIRGVEAYARNVGSGAATGARASIAGIENVGTGSIGEAYGYYVNAPTNTGGGTITSYYGMRIEEPTVATTNNFALQIDGGRVLINVNQATSLFTVRSAFDTGAFEVTSSFEGTSVSIGVGAPLAEGKLSVYKTWTGTSGNVYGTESISVANPSGATSAVYVGSHAVARSTAGNAFAMTGVVAAFSGVLDHNSDGAITTARVVSAVTTIDGAGDITGLTSFYARPFLNTAANVPTYIGFNSDPPVLASTGAITTLLNFQALMPTSGTYTTLEGLRISDPTGVTATNLYAIRALGGNVLFNGNRGAYVTQMHGDTRDNIMYIDGTNDAVGFGVGPVTTSFFAVTQAAATSGVKRMATWVAGAHTGLTAATEVQDVYFDLSRTVSWASGAIATQRAFYVDAPTYSVTAGVSQVITTAATFAISGAPAAAGDGTTITNSYAFWVQTGRIVADGGLLVGAEPTGIAGKVGYTNTVDNTANSSGVGTILFKGTTNRNSSGFLKILDGTTARYLPYFDAITG